MFNLLLNLLMWLDVLCERLPFSAFDRNTTNFDYIISFLGYISEERSFGKNFIGHHCWKPLNIFSFLISCKTYVCLCYLSIPIFFSFWNKCMRQRFLFHSSEFKAFLYFFPVFWIRFFSAAAVCCFIAVYSDYIFSYDIFFLLFCGVFYLLSSLNGNALPEFFTSDQNLFCADISNLYDITNALHFL